MHGHVGPNWRSRSKPQTAGDIARDAIPLLEAAIKERYGLNLYLGAELEFSIIPNEIPRGWSDNPLRLTMNKEHTPSAQRPPARQDPFFASSPIISSSYRETAKPTAWGAYQYEYVFSHKSGLPACAIADHITDTKSQLLGKKPELTGQNHLTPNLPYPFPQGYYSRLYFDPVLLHDAPPRPGQKVTAETPHYTQGLHISLSLAADGQSVEAFNAAHTGIKRSLANAIYQVCKEGAYAIDSGMSADRRLWPDGSTRYATEGVIDDYKPGRIENKLADSQADPHITVMLNLVGLLHGLDAIQFDKNNHSPIQPYPSDPLAMPTSHHAQRLAFQHQSVLSAALNDLDPAKRLGDAFKQAVLTEKALGNNR